MKRVLWKEGLFLKPQHFQKQDYLWADAWYQLYLQQGPYAFGLAGFEFTKTLLAKGDFSISHLSGVMPDGTVFNFKGTSSLSVHVPKGVNNEWIVLALPKKRSTGIRVAQNRVEAVDEPCVIQTEMVSDELIGEQERIEIEILEPNFSLRVVKNLNSLNGFDVLPLIKVLEVRENQEMLIDENFIPPMLSIRSSLILNGYVEEISGYLTARRIKLLDRISGVNQHGVSGATELLLLQLINRYEPLLQHYQRQTDLHPEKIYTLLLQLAGELRTFTSEDRGYTHAPAYEHTHLNKTFDKLMKDLRDAFNYVFDEPAILIPFESYKYNLYLASFTDKLNLDDQRLVLAVKADMPAEQLRNLFPTHVKIGPTELIRDLVNLQVPGIGVSLLPVAPRQIPYHNGYLYFELDNHAEMWLKLRESPGLALHLGGNFPNVDLKLWAIRN